MIEKAPNPKDAVGIRKVMMSVVPWGVIMELAVAMLEGALKYGRHNYRPAGVRASVYFDANMRHLADWWEGQDIDPDSGLSHVIKAIASLTVLRDSMMTGNWIDDRAPRSLEPDWLAQLNRQVAELQDKYRDPEEPWTNERYQDMLREADGNPQPSEE